MNSTSNDGWLLSLLQARNANDPGIYPVGICYKCCSPGCYMPAFQSLSGEIACLKCGSGPGSHVMQTGVVPIQHAAWQVNHAQFTTSKPPTIEEVHSLEHCNVEPLTRHVLPRIRPTEPPLENGTINLDDHVTLGSEDGDKSPIMNHHRGRINSAIDEDEGDMQQQHGPAKK